MAKKNHVPNSLQFGMSNRELKRRQAEEFNRNYNTSKALDAAVKMQHNMRFVNGEASHPQLTPPPVPIDETPIPIGEVVLE
jgi:hypothetical protein